LAKLCEKYLDISLEKDVRSTFIGKADFEFSDEQIRYSFEDVYVLFDLREKLESILNERRQANTFFEIEMPLLPIVAKMEFDGILFDVKKWQELAVKAREDQERHTLELYSILANNFNNLTKAKTAYDAFVDLKIPTSTLRKAEKERLKNVTVRDDIKAEVLASINWGSPYQPKVILNKLGVPVKTTDKKELQHFAEGYPIVKSLLSARGDSKRVETYGDDFLKNVNAFTGCIHTSFHQDGAGTGRFSSSEPNLQNIIADEDYRACFIARPNKVLITADYSNIELRIIGEASKEPKYIQAFQAGEDLHALTASLLYNVPLEQVTKEQRRLAKSLNFAVIYGTTAKGLAFTFNITLAEAGAYLRKYFSVYNVLKTFIEKFADQCIKQGYAPTMSGRKRFLKFPYNPRTEDEHRTVLKARRQAVNNLPQGTSADMIKLALIYMGYENPFGDKFKLLLTVHDEIVAEVDCDIASEADVFMENCMKRAGEKYLKLIPIKIGRSINTYWVKD
jgi:DNA polymerase I-like protein with 3'-5' exonuclease and polymerase domains